MFTITLDRDAGARNRYCPLCVVRELSSFSNARPVGDTPAPRSELRLTEPRSAFKSEDRVVSQQREEARPTKPGAISFELLWRGQ